MDEHVGTALQTRRKLVLVSLDDVIRVAGAGHVADLKWIETADHPSLRRIKWHYAWVQQAATARGTWRELPYAQRSQWYDTGLDEALWETVRTRVPSRAWWWGRGGSKGKTGAVCFVCGAWIYSYDAANQMSGPARIALMAHRATHPVAGLPAPRLYTEENAA